MGRAHGTQRIEPLAGQQLVEPLAGQLEPPAACAGSALFRGGGQLNRP